MDLLSSIAKSGLLVDCEYYVHYMVFLEQQSVPYWDTSRRPFACGEDEVYCRTNAPAHRLTRPNVKTYHVTLRMDIFQLFR